MRFKVTVENNESDPLVFWVDSIAAAQSIIHALLTDPDALLSADDLQRLDEGLSLLTDEGGEVWGSSTWKERATVECLRQGD